MIKAKNFNSLLREKTNITGSIGLHEPIFKGNEKKYLSQAIDNTNVSSKGKFIDRFEKNISSLTNNKFCVATVNGTSALQIALILADVKQNDEVLTQALTFVATSNAIAYLKAKPVFIDVDRDTMGMSPLSLSSFLQEFGEKRENGTYNKSTGKKISACLPMHTFGFMCRIDEIKKICKEWKITLVEDSAEALGSKFKGEFAGTFGALSAYSFNGNKVITSGGGGCITTQNKNLYKRAKHISSTAKSSGKFHYFHNEIGYNFRMPNLNAALACAQIESFQRIIERKIKLYEFYAKELPSIGIELVPIPKNTTWNYWLIPILLDDKKERDNFLKETDSFKIMTRPIWTLLFKLPMFSLCQKDSQKNALFLENKIVNIPSNVRI
ncbi:MAG: aminotransferase DegT [Flavobacteriales bacterium]|nr:aminotransferase DegT [Flavobacteriales bacterium]